MSHVANNHASSASAKTAAKKYEEELKKQLLVEPRIYVITPDTLTESALESVKAVLRKAGYQDIQPPVHPKRAMDNGFEVVFYLPEDQQEAEALVRTLAGELHWPQKPPVKAPPEKSARPRQFDIHIGPDIAEQLMHPPVSEKAKR